ncbi:hypothetical protein EYF80_057309 [Liparis tanakae]|uniref:Uncharacterized protein n=1 Tax=Liparis tanakae TaxID=230148 RepID=A0A4Z2EUQ8_9TELE|nr:hypothetical protein EYF80_057309 [Liparis tanakae]
MLSIGELPKCVWVSSGGADGTVGTPGARLEEKKKASDGSQSQMSPAAAERHMAHFTRETDHL